MSELDVRVPWQIPAFAIGSRDETVEPLGSVMWFEEKFLDEKIVEAPGCTWEWRQAEGDYVYQIVRKGYEKPGRPTQKVWRLTGEWRIHEYGTPWASWQMKAVWPD